MISFRLSLLALALAFTLPAFAEESPIGPALCTDNLQSAADLQEIETFRTELATNSALRTSNHVAAQAASDALIEAFAGNALAEEQKTLIEDVKILVENPLFDEALARSFKVAGIKKGESILEFQSRLKLTSEANQIGFSELVLKQYEDLLYQAFVFADEDKFEMIGKRWGLGTEQTYDVLTRWSAGSVTDRAQIQIAVLAWAKVVDPEQLVREIKAIKKIPRKLRLTDTEDVLLTRIQKPHYDQDLAQNIGPISDREFAHRMRMWNFLGWAQHKLNLIRYPKEASFVIALSVAPVTLIHALGHDWNLTNTVATIIGGVATCPPLVVQMTKRAMIKNREAVFLDILTVKQLSELRRWMGSHPKRAAEVGFGDLEKPLEERIAKLRELRYKLR
jgi:hypothetical protein